MLTVDRAAVCKVLVTAIATQELPNWRSSRNQNGRISTTLSGGRDSPAIWLISRDWKLVAPWPQLFGSNRRAAQDVLLR